MQQLSPKAWYGASAFAKLSGVTVRTLHHYDRLGLLKPRERSARGYRLYHTNDLERVEQIAALKFLGLSLSVIARVLRHDSFSLSDELGRQQTALTEKRRLLDRALTAITEARSAIQQGKPAAELLRQIIGTLKMQQDANWMLKYYSPSAQNKIAERAVSFTPEMQAEISAAWKRYYRDLAALKDQPDPGGALAAELSQRHRELVAAFTANDPEIEAGLTALYRDRENWPTAMEDRMSEYEAATQSH